MNQAVPVVAPAIGHRFTIGSVLADAIRVFVRQFPKLLLVTVAVLPMMLVGPLLPDIAVESPIYTQIVVPLLVDSLATTSTLIAEAAMVMVVLHQLRGQASSWRNLLTWLPMAGTVIAGGLMIWLPDLMGRTGFHILAMKFPEWQWRVALPYCTGLAVYFAVLVFWIMFVPVVVAEREGIRAALTRSAQLGKGERWRIFALLLILLVIGVVASYGLFLVAYMTFGAWSSPPDDLPSMLIIYGGYSLYTMFSSSVSITMFHHLRLREEGMDSARAVTAFD